MSSRGRSLGRGTVESLTGRQYKRVADGLRNRGLPTMIVLDASASMAFPVSTNAKWRLASQLAVGLAAVARSSADPVGLVIAREVRKADPSSLRSSG